MKENAKYLLTVSVKRLIRGLSSILFPAVCVCCGRESAATRRPVCPFCLESRFEHGNPEHRLSASGVLLPRYVPFQHALWKFDKGGALQDLMHCLKYERMADVALQMGECLGRELDRHRALDRFVRLERALLLPVPLHPVKRRVRGFNQADRIARGIRRIRPLPQLPGGTVVRRRNTSSQTGLSLKKRVANLEGAFEVRRPELIRGQSVLLVDDVFTTGATTFELAARLHGKGVRRIAILTAARA